MQQRLDELEQLDNRIAQRIAHLGRMEQSLRALCESLRTQVLEAHPLIGRLNELRNNGSLIDTIVEQVKREITLEPANPPAIGAQEPPDIGDQLALAVQGAVESLHERARAIHEDLSGTVESARHYVDQAHATARQSAGQVLEALERKLSEVRAATASLQDVEQTPLGRAAASAENQLDGAVALFTSQADATLEAVRRSVEMQVSQLSAQTTISIKPLLAKIDDQKRTAEAMLAAAAESAERDLARRADELKRNAEKMVELCERQLIDRIANIRPRTRAAIESFEHAANQRVAQSIAEMESAVSRSELHAIERVEAVRPRCAEMLRQLHADVQDQLKQLEDDAVAGVHWLEHRLAGRVEALKHRLGGTMRDEIEKIDSQLPCEKPRPVSPVSVQLMTPASPSVTANAA